MASDEDKSSPPSTKTDVVVLGPPTPDGAGVELRLHSPHGDMGFPGALDLTAVYRLVGAGTLAVDYRAVTDRATVLNPTSHAYFNLAGHGTVHDHLLQLSADRYLPVDAAGIPYGPAEPVAVRLPPPTLKRTVPRLMVPPLTDSAAGAASFAESAPCRSDALPTETR